MGFVLGGIGEVNEHREANFMVVEKGSSCSSLLHLIAFAKSSLTSFADTSVAEILDRFKRFLERDDIAIIIINQIYADMIRTTIDKHILPTPTVVEIPSKQHAYDSSRDSILKRAHVSCD